MDISNEISLNDLAKWGLLRTVQKEIIKDEIIEGLAKPSSNERESLLKHWLQANCLDTSPKLCAWLNKEMIVKTQLNERIERDWLWSQWCLVNFKAEIPSYYLKQKKLLDQVTYSLIRVKKKALAEELYLRIKEEEASFEFIARNHSEGPEKNSSGLIGPVPLSQPHPELAHILQLSQPAQLWPPRQLEKWWIIVRLEELHPTKLESQTKLKLALKLGNKHLETTLDKNKTIHS